MSITSTISTRPLGKTGIQVTPIGLGVMELSGGGVYGVAFPNLSQEAKNAIIKSALNNGINWFDTAEMYGAGRSESALAVGLHAAGTRSGEVVVATKWSPFLRTARNIPRTIHTRRRFLAAVGESDSIYTPAGQLHDTQANRGDLDSGFPKRTGRDS